MLTGLKNCVRFLPPIKRLLRERDELRRQLAELQSWGEPSYNHDSLRTYSKNLSFLQEERFRLAYRAGMQLGHKSIPGDDIHVEYRAHIACWAAQHAKHLPGDLVECGVARGCLSGTICHYIGFNETGKSFYLFDTFKGIPEEQMLPTERAHAREHNEGSYDDCYEIVKRKFAPYPRVRLIRGKVPDTFAQVQIDKVCYLSIDMNIAAPEVAAMRFFWDKLVTGAVVVFDDYGWSGYEEQHKALDAFAAEKGVRIATLPTGQGLLLKP
jgi:hypothetical protein